MENIFNVVPDLVDWIPAQDRGRSTQVCREWKRTLSKDKVTRRQLAWKWPLLGILFEHRPDDWVPTQIVSDLEHGLHGRQIAFDRRTQSVAGHITNGWIDWLNVHAPSESALSDFEYHRQHTQFGLSYLHCDTQFVSVISDFIYDKISGVRSCPCPARSEIAKMYAVVNLYSLSTDGVYTYGWKGVSNCRAQTWSPGTFYRPNLAHGCEKLMETDEFILFRRNS